MPINTNSCFCDMKTVQTTDLTFKVLPKKKPEALNKDVKKPTNAPFLWVLELIPRHNYIALL